VAKKYRVVHERRSAWEALLTGRGYRDCYLAQAGGLWGWRTIKTCASAGEAEEACREHAGGTLLPNGGRVIAEFERPEKE
jgi:hypothetical protein